MEIRCTGMSQLESNYRGQVSIAKTCQQLLVISGITRKGFPSTNSFLGTPHPYLGHILLAKMPGGDSQRGQLESICHRPQGLA